MTTDDFLWNAYFEVEIEESSDNESVKKVKQALEFYGYNEDTDAEIEEKLIYISSGVFTDWDVLLNDGTSIIEKIREYFKNKTAT